MIEEVAAHHWRLKDVVVSTSDSLELELLAIVDLFLTVKRGSRESTASSETSGVPSCMPLVPGNDWYASQ